jgi:hypothetical protein
MQKHERRDYRMGNKLLSSSDWTTLLVAAALLGLVDLKSGVELAIITVFVYVGIRVAPRISELILIR